jgi:hypothetical protein
MSLEQSIQELTAAVKALIDVFPVVRTMSVSQDTEVTHLVRDVPIEQFVEEQKAAVKKSKSAASNTGQGAASEQAPVVAEQPITPQEKNTTDISPPSESEFAPVTYDDVKKATNALSAAKGRDVTIDALSRFGVKRATELDEGQWSEYIMYVDTVIRDE